MCKLVIASVMRCSRSWISLVNCWIRRASNRNVYVAALVTLLGMLTFSCAQRWTRTGLLRPDSPSRRTGQPRRAPL